MKEGRSRGRALRVVGLCLALVALPGCIDLLSEESKNLLVVITVLLGVNIILNLALIVLLVFYFFPFTRPWRKPRRRRR